MPAAAVVIAFATGGWVLDRSYHEAPPPETDVRAGVRTVMFTPLTAGDHQIGQAYVYPGPSSWIYLSLDTDNDAANGTILCELIHRGGSTVPLGTFFLTKGCGAWGTPASIDRKTLATIRLINGDGHLLATTQFGRPVSTTAEQTSSAQTSPPQQPLRRDEPAQPSPISTHLTPPHPGHQQRQDHRELRGAELTTTARQSRPADRALSVNVDMSSDKRVEHLFHKSAPPALVVTDSLDAPTHVLTTDQRPDVEALDDPPIGVNNLTQRCRWFRCYRPPWMVEPDMMLSNSVSPLRSSPIQRVGRSLRSWPPGIQRWPRAEPFVIGWSVIGSYRQGSFDRLDDHLKERSRKGIAMTDTPSTMGIDRRFTISRIQNSLGQLSGATLSAVRIVVSFLFICHGALILFGAFGGIDKHGATAPVGSWPLWWAGVVHLAGGGLVLLGLFTRSAALLCSGAMAFAYFTVHQPQGLLPLQNNGESAALYCGIFLLIAVLGPSPYTLDTMLRRRSEHRLLG